MTIRAARRCIAPFAVVTALLYPATLLAHAVVYPKASKAGGYEKYILRIPNEKDVPTTRVEIRFPADVRVVAFADVPGWQLEVVRDSARAITAAIWTGTLDAERFVEFPFEAANPKTPTRVSWSVYQTYASGERVEWTGPEHSKTPAPITAIETASALAGLGFTSWIAAAAFLLAFASVGLTVRRPAPAAAL